jgi:Biotin-lipoyl like
MHFQKTNNKKQTTMPNLSEKPEDIALNERQEILQFIGRPPSVFLRFAITTVACVVGLLLALSYFIKYPDIVVAKVVLTTENPPIHVLAKTGGRVSEILIKNNETVKTGQLLAVMDNTANWHDVLTLDKIITEDRRVVERILDRFRDLMRNR